MRNTGRSRKNDGKKSLEDTEEQGVPNLDDLPPFLRKGKSQISEDPNSENLETHPEEADTISQEEDAATGAPQSFWDRFKPALTGTTRKGRTPVRTAIQNSRFSQVILLCLLGLLLFTVIQQISTEGFLRTVTGLAAVFTLPYLAVFLLSDLRDYWYPKEGQKDFPHRFNVVLGPAIVTLAISSCVFSAPLEGKVWIIGNKTTGSTGTMYAVPLFSKIVSIPQKQEVVMDVSSRTADGVEVKAQISALVTCCVDDPNQIIATYKDEKNPWMRHEKNERPIDTIERYLKEVFDAAFKREVAQVKVADIKSAYARMAQGISKKAIREQSALMWNGKFTVISSRADLPSN
ncbi:hypothetical protein HYW94_00750 [Candidatus Uhrbacteria bacterium]|nr:hypothetical protein [Candidatus Uhrbacteria bacterium]